MIARGATADHAEVPIVRCARGSTKALALGASDLDLARALPRASARPARAVRARTRQGAASLTIAEAVVLEATTSVVAPIS